MGQTFGRQYDFLNQGGTMTQPSRAADALRRAVEAQRAQREAAAGTSRGSQTAAEEGIETPDQDRDQ